MQKSELECIVAAILAAGEIIASEEKGGSGFMVKRFQQMREALKKADAISHD